MIIIPCYSISVPQKSLDQIAVHTYNIFISPNFRLPTSNIKQMLLNKRTTSENTRYSTKRLRTRLTFAQKRMFVLNSLVSPNLLRESLPKSMGLNKIQFLISGKIRRSDWLSTQSQKSSIE